MPVLNVNEKDSLEIYDDDGILLVNISTHDNNELEVITINGNVMLESSEIGFIANWFEGMVNE